MKNQRIIFPEANRAALVDWEYKEPGAGEVTVKTFVSTISPGTERANLTGNPNVAGQNAPSVVFPRWVGYSSAGYVEAVGDGVTSVKVGDRAIVYWGTHSRYNTVPEKQIIRIDDDRLSFAEAAMIFISTFPLAAIRKTRLEIGEAALVMGLGLLGQFAVRLLRAAGAVPVIAADPVADRRQTALAGGADYALDPTQPGFADEVKRLTGGKGVAAAIEVTGVGAGFDIALDCMAPFGRIALLGCTRDPNFTIDYYRKIHCPGITVIGAHTRARPEEESHPGYFTHRDDIAAVMKLIAAGRLDFRSMICETHAPEDCPAVYDRLVNDRSFPIVTQFLWQKEDNV